MMRSATFPVRPRGTSPSRVRPFARWAAAAALVLLAPASAGAQFTTSVRPPEPAPDPVIERRSDSVVVARRDSVAAAERLDLRAWVDSAAGALVAGMPPATPVADSPSDTVLAPLPPAEPVRPPAEPVPPGETTVFREGAPAPATATPLPLLALAGAALAGLGAALRRR